MSKKSESASRGDSLDAEMTSLKVAVRVRPLNDKEINLGSKIVVDVHGNDIVITDLKVPEHQGYDHRSRVHKFSFDYGFSSVDPASVQYASQATVFENFGRVVLQALLEGYNCCVIAYGQSGSGKTYTMMGMKGEEGLTPKICEGLLMKLEDKAKQNISFAVNISYMEIYNEQVYDLLQKSDERTNLNKPRLRVREHPVHGPFVEGLSTHVLRSRDNVCQLISEGNDNRVKAATYIHDRSSRSHAIFTVHCSQACLDESQPKEVVSKLQLVDLAGSEKAGHEFCQSRLKEGASINKSLVTLGNVISALVELSQRFQNGSCKGGKQLFVPYRDSQLTWLMKDSLGGNSHTFMLAAVSPSNECCSETLSTLRYAQRAKSILSIPVVNEDPATKLIRNLRLEVSKLKSLLTNADVLSKKAVIEPLANISHLNSIMKKSEKKVDHLIKCWFEKWLETYNTVLKKTNYMNEGSSAVAKGTDVPQIQNVSSNSPAERIDNTPCDCINLNSSETQYASSLSFKAEESESILSDKSSSVSSECIILPNETIFYSKGRRNDRHQNYFKDCTSYLKSASLNHVSDTKGEIIMPPDEYVKDSSNRALHILSSSLNDISPYKTTFNSVPILNCLSVSAPSVHGSLSLHHPLLTSFSLPKEIEASPEYIKTIKESEKENNFLEGFDGTSNCFENTCEEKTSQVITPTVNHVEDYSFCEVDPEIRVDINSDEFSQEVDLSSTKFSQQKIENDTSKDYISTSDHNDCSIPKIQTNNETLYAEERGGKQWSDGLSTSNIFTNCTVNTTGKIYSCRDVEFNDSVAEESDNFVKLLNQLQDGSVETISQCIHRKDSEILSLLSLSSNDYPPFHSLDEIFNDGDDIEIPDETGSIEFDALCENKDQYERDWDEVHSCSNVTDLSESSDAESEFDYLDFTNNTTGMCSKIEVCSDSSVITSNEQQNIQNSELLRKINKCKENLLSIPEESIVPEPLRNSDASELYAENKCVDVSGVSKAVTTGDEMKFESGNSVCAEEVLMCKNVHINNSSVSCSKNLTTDSKFHANEITNSMNISDSRNEEFTVYEHKDLVLQNRLCNSDSILKATRNSEIKCCSKSDNIVHIACEECSIPTETSVGSKRKEIKTSYENVANNDNIKQTHFKNKDSISDLLDFSVQDLLDMINGKGDALLKKQNYPTSEERLQYDSTIPEEIQTFIDSTEITDASKLADELLKKKLPQCSTSVPTSNDSVLAHYSDQNKLSLKSNLYSLHSDTDSASYKCHNESSIIHSQTEKLNMKGVLDAEKSNSVTPKTHIADITHETDNVKHTEEAKVEAFNTSEENGNFKHEKLHMAIEKVHCEKENALEYFTFNGCKEIALGSLCDYMNNPGDPINETMEFPKSQQISVANISTAKEIFSEDSTKLDMMPLRSNFQNFLTKSADDDITDRNSQANIFTEYCTFANLNITGLPPIEEEVVDDNDVISEASADDSPNISFQFDSLERPKNGSAVEKDSTCVEHFSKTDIITYGKDNAKKLFKSENMSNMLNDVSKIFYNKNYDFSVETCAETEKQDQHKDLPHLNFKHPKCTEISKETVNPKDILKLPSPPNFMEDVTKSTADTCSLAVESQDSHKYSLPFNRENDDKYNVRSEEINEAAESPKSNLKLKISDSKEVNNLTNQLYSWDSLSSSTSSDSITFVFVGKDNKNVMSAANSRSFQSSLFSSVSLDSLEKSSVYQNQIACSSPRTLSIDSLVAEELLFQLRNSDTVQPLRSEIKQDVGNTCEVSSNILTDQKSASKKTNFAATSQLCSTQHLKMYHHMHSNMENEILQDSSTEILGKEVYEKQNATQDVGRNQVVTYQSNTFHSGGYSGNSDDSEFQKVREKYSCISPESNGDAAEETCSYLQTTNSEEHQIAENVCCSISNDCNKESPADDIHACKMLQHIPEGNVFNTCVNSSVTVSHFDSIDFKSHYDLDFQSNNSNIVVNHANVTASDKNLEHMILDNYDSVQKQMYLPENMCSKNNSFCNKCITADNNELLSVKELTEENLKIFNSEFEENQEENFILPPPSTFGGSEDNGLSVISNCSSFSLDHHQSKASVDVISKSTQTDQNTPTECNKSEENNAVMYSGKTDLIERMMDLMAETLKLMKEQYSRTPKSPHSHTRRKLNFSGDSDKNMSDSKEKMVAPPTTGKHRKYLSKNRSTDSKVMKYIQSVLPPDNESDYVIEDFSHPLTHSELSPYPQKSANEKYVSMRNKVNHGDQRIGCAMGKNPNFYTLPFDFITCKYQCEKLPNASKLKKPDTFSQTSVDYLPDKTKNSNLINNKVNNLSAFKSVAATNQKVSHLNGISGLKQCLPKPSSSKSHLKHLIELRRQVVEATQDSSNVRENLNCENHITNSLKSPSSSSEGYLSSVSSRGPFRHLSEASTDSQEFTCTAEHLLPKQCFPKHNVKPLDFSTQCDRNVAVSPDTRWLNNSADSGAFFLDSPGTEKKANLDEYPTTATYSSNTSKGVTSSAACTSSKKLETRSPLHSKDVLTASINPQEAKVSPFSRINHWGEIKNGRKLRDKTDFALGFQELDEIGENYLGISLRENVSVNSSISSDLSFCTGKALNNRNPKSSRMPRNSPKLKHVSSQEIQRLLESIENDRRLLRQIHDSHVLNKKYSPSHILPSCSSLEFIDDLFYQDTYKSLPSSHGRHNSSASVEV